MCREVNEGRGGGEVVVVAGRRRGGGAGGGGGEERNVYKFVALIKSRVVLRKDKHNFQMH